MSRDSQHYVEGYPDIVVTEDNVIVSERDFERLAHYQTSMPTGPKPGRIWRRNDMLAIVYESDEPGYIDITWRPIVKRRIAA